MVELGKCEFIQAGVLLHPSFVAVEDIKGMSPALRYSDTIFINYPISMV